MNPLGFINPALWIGALALSVPVLVHLLTRNTPRVLVFPTLQFLKKSQANLSALFRLRHLILMALRTLFLAFLVMGFVRPVWYGKQTPPPANDKKDRAAVLIFDASASMSQRGGGGAPLT